MDRIGQNCLNSVLNGLGIDSTISDNCIHACETPTGTFIHRISTTSHQSLFYAPLPYPSSLFPSHSNPFLHFPPPSTPSFFPSFHPLLHLRLLATHSPPVWSLLYTPLLSPVCFWPHSSTSQSLLVGRT